MTLPNQDIKMAIDAIRQIQRRFRIARVSIAMDMGIKTSSLYAILEYDVIPPEGSENRDKIFAYVEKLRVKYPEEFCSQEAIQK